MLSVRVFRQSATFVHHQLTRPGRMIEFDLCSLVCQLVTCVSWLSSIESSQWLYYLSQLMQSACQVVKTLDIDCRPVLVHCSDGWDRTPQLTSLAEIMLDPFYRTVPVSVCGISATLSLACLVLSTRDLPS